MAYTTKAQIRLLGNLTASDISDDDLDSIIAQLPKEINPVINIKINRERIAFIDSTRENKIDESNKTYYIRNWRANFIADANYDSAVTIADLTVYAVESDGTETTDTVASVTYDEGKFITTTAFSSDFVLFVTYQYSAIDPVTPDGTLELAATYLAIAYSYLQKDAKITGPVKFGSVTINKKVSQSFDLWFSRYELQLQKLNKGNIGGGSWGEASVKI